MRWLALVLCACFLVGSATAADQLFRDEFESLDNWTELQLSPKLKKTTFSPVRVADTSAVELTTKGSASALVHSKKFSIADYPTLRFRWKVDKVFETGDARRKDGDDYPVRVYVLFEFDPKTASFADRMKFGVAKRRFGSYPPDCSLNYIWANRQQAKRIIPNSYTSRSQMVVVEQGGDKVGTWCECEVDMLKDFREAFGKEPPAVAQIAIMADSDNTDGESTAWIDYIEVRK